MPAMAIRKMSYLSVENLSLDYDSRPALNQVSFSLEQRQIGALIGPSGSGKTSLLRCIAGLDRACSGRVVCDGQVVNDGNGAIATERRSVGMVLQNPALFPHMTVADNIAFGIRRTDKARQSEIVEELLSLTDMAAFAARMPDQLSGGEQQRVAIARALARQPSLLLLDEPFSALDAELRPSLAQDIASIIRAKQQTALIVTHDQNEAFAVADTMAILDKGSLLQQGSCYELYHMPRSRAVADFVGLGTFAKGKVVAENQISSTIGIIEGSIDPNLEVGDSIEVLLRPDDIIHDDDSPVTATILEKTFRGAVFLYTLLYEGGQKLFCYAPSHHDHKIGEAIGIRLEVDHIICFK